MDRLSVAARGQAKFWSAAAVAALVLSVAGARVSYGAAVLWDHGGADLLWSTGANWDNLGADLPGIPGPADTVTFTDTGSSGTQGTVTNIVDASTTIASLTYANTTPNYHTTQINTGQTLTVTGDLSIGPNAFASGTVTIKGQTSGTGTLVVNNTAASVLIDPGPTNWYTPGHTVLADLTDLGNFTANVSAVNIARTGAVTATFNLAQNSSITADKISMGLWNSTGTLNLGQTTALNVDNIYVAGETTPPAGAVFNLATGTIQFRSGVTNPSLTIRGKAGGSSRANMIIGIGGAVNTPNTGTVNFDSTTGASLDALLNNLTVGVGGAAVQGTGTFQFNFGTVDANTVLVGQTGTGATGHGTGTLTIGGTGNLIAGSLTVGDALHAGKTATGTVNLNAGSLRATTIQGGASTGTAVRAFNWTSGTIGNKLGGDLTIAASMPLTLLTTADHVFDAETGRTITVNSAISESGAAAPVTKTGGGTVAFSGSGVVYTGATTITNGTLALQDTTAFGSDINVGPSGALNLVRSVAGAGNRIRITRLISGSGTINVNNTGSGVAGGWVIFDSATHGLNNFTGTINVNSGVLSVDAIAGAWSGNPDVNVAAGGVFSIRAQNISIDALTGNGDVANTWNGHGAAGDTLTVGANNGSGLFSGVIHGTVASGGTDGTLEQGIVNLVKAGTGTQTLTGANTYAGTTIINDGTLQIGDGGTTGTLGTGAVTINSPGNLIFNRSNSYAVPNTIGGTGSLTQAGSGTTTLSGSGIAYTGTTTVSGGKLIFSNTTSLNTSVANSTTVEINAASAGDTWILGGNKTFSGAGTWIKTGPGRATLNNTTLTTSGQFLIQQGTLRNNSNSSNWSGSTADMDISAGAILDLYADAVYVNKLTGSGFVQNGYGNGGGYSGSGPYIEKFVVGVAGGSSTFDGEIRDNATYTAPASDIAGGGVQLEKAGAGTLTLTGANKYTGGTTLSGGTLKLENPAALPGNLNYTNSATLSVGNGANNGQAGLVTFTAAAGSQYFDLNGNTFTVAGLTGSPTVNSLSAVQNNLAATTGTLVIDNTANYTYAGVVRNQAGTLALTKKGSGRQTLLGGNITYTGPTTVNNGTLVLQDTAAFNSAISNSAVVEFNAAGGFGLGTGVALSGSGTWNKTGPGTLQFVGTNQAIAATGQFNIKQGKLQNNNNTVNWSGNTASMDISTGAILDLYADAVYVDKLTGTGFVQNGYGNAGGYSGSGQYIEKFVVGVAGGSSTFDGEIRDNATYTPPSGAAAGGGVQLVKTGAGTLTLTGNNSYTGGTLINQGTLRLAAPALPSGQPLPGSALWLDATTLSGADGSPVATWPGVGGAGQVAQADVTKQPTLAAGAINGLQAVRFSTAGIADVIYNTTNYTSAVTVFSVSKLNGGANQRLVTSTSNNWLLGYWSGGIDKAYFEGWVNNPAPVADTNPHMYEGVIRGSGQNSDVYVYDSRNAGVVQLASNTGGVTGPNGLALGGVGTGPGEPSNGDVGEVLIYYGVLSAAQRQIVENYLINKWFGGSFVNTVNILSDTSPVTVAGGTLDIGALNETVGAVTLQSGAIIGSGGTLTGSSYAVHSGSVSANLGGAASLVKSTAGTVVLSGTNTYTGMTTVSDGTLLVNGSIAGAATVNGGTLGGSGSIGGLVTVNSPGILDPGGSPGVLTLEAGVTFNGGVFRVQLDGTTPGLGGYDQLLVTGGDVVINPATQLDPSLGYATGPLDYLWIILNEGTGTTSGYFAGMEEGSSVGVGGAAFNIFYHANFATGSTTGGNDVLLTTAPEPSAIVALLGLAAMGLAGYLRRRRRLS